ncbi:MAG: T9SS type A sorting domain-containing protein [Ignavibacteria bacterium]
MNLFTKLISILFLLSTLINFADSQTVYTWNGSVSSNFSAAGNWTPFRQIGLVNDILVFENSGNLNVTNVYQVTIGQLIIRNNTNLTLSPASGNAKVLTIKGTAIGEDFAIEPGSSLRIQGNDPSLNLYLSTGATASIKGSLSLEGTISHNLNAADPMAVRFQSGSTFTQLCPGNIFNTTGANNAIVFESGSIFRINHANASNPFGLAAPNSKVMFQNSSSLILSSIGSIQLAGRTIAYLTVEQGTIVNISESFTSDINVSNITINNGAIFSIKNTNPNYIPSLNISGNIKVNGTFKFSDDATSKFNIKFNGSTLQDIAGTGTILIPSNLNRFELLNSISLNKDLAVNCPIVMNRYEIIKNGFEFTFNPEFGNPFNGSKTSTGSENAAAENGLTDNSINPNLPADYSISQNYPNPFNPSTKIDFSLPQDAKVTIKVFDITGKEAANLVNSDMNAGNHSISFNASNLSSGIYFYTISAGNFSKTMKMILTK